MQRLSLIRRPRMSWIRCTCTQSPSGTPFSLAKPGASEWKVPLRGKYPRFQRPAGSNGKTGSLGRFRSGSVAFAVAAVFVCASAIFGDEPLLLSRVTGTGVAELEPTRILISIPIRVKKEVAADAIAELRERRVAMVQRAIELGANADAVKTVGFECNREGRSRSIRALPGNARTSETSQVASCYLVADFAIPSTDDYEAMLAIAQAYLNDLLATLPPEQQPESASRSSYYSGPLDARQLEGPLVVFAAPAGEEEIKAAYQEAVSDARQKFDAIASISNADAIEPAVQVSSGNRYVSSSLRHHPVADAVRISDPNWTVSAYPDSLDYQLSVTLTATPPTDRDSR